MSVPADRDPQAWIAKARADLLCIDNNLRGPETPWDIVAFHAQQAAEKILKGWLVSRGLEHPRTHELNYLLELCVKAGAPFQELLPECSRLTVYAVRFRYPGPEADATEADVRAAVTDARRVMEVVLPTIPPTEAG